MELLKHEEFVGLIRNLTDLRVGGTADAAGIGDMDNPIIKHPVTNTPYIPGSSVKGKLRSLLEQKYRAGDRESAVASFGKPCDCGKCFVCSLFGCGATGSNSKDKDIRPTRVIFRDAHVSAESAKVLAQALPGANALARTHTAINRRTGRIQDGSLHTVEAVPADTTFDFSFTVRVFKEDIPQLAEWYAKLAEAFEMLERDALGGCGSRGYGRVRITDSDGKTPMRDVLLAKAKEAKS